MFQVWKTGRLCCSKRSYWLLLKIRSKVNQHSKLYWRIAIVQLKMLTLLLWGGALQTRRDKIKNGKPAAVHLLVTTPLDFDSIFAKCCCRRITLQCKWTRESTEQASTSVWAVHGRKITLKHVTTHWAYSPRVCHTFWGVLRPHNSNLFHITETTWLVCIFLFLRNSALTTFPLIACTQFVTWKDRAHSVYVHARH